MEMDAGENLGVIRGALSIDLHNTVADLLPSLSQDSHHVVGGAAPSACQHRLHRAWTHVSPSALCGAVHHNRVVALRLSHKARARNPLHQYLQSRFSSTLELRKPKHHI